MRYWKQQEPARCPEESLYEEIRQGFFHEEGHWKGGCGTLKQQEPVQCPEESLYEEIRQGFFHEEGHWKGGCGTGNSRNPSNARKNHCMKKSDRDSSMKRGIGRVDAVLE